MTDNEIKEEIISLIRKGHSPWTHTADKIMELTKRPQDNNTTCPSREEFAKELFNSLGGCIIKETTGHTIYDRWVCAKFGKDNSGMDDTGEPKEPVHDCGCGMGESCHALKKERKVSLEEIEEVLRSNGEIKHIPVSGDLVCGYLKPIAQAILSLLNAVLDGKEGG